MHQHNIDNFEYYKSILNAASKNYNKLSLKSIKGIINYLYVAHKHKADIKHFLKRIENIKHPNFNLANEKMGVIVWPYIHNEWVTKTKLDVMANHYELLAVTCPELIINNNASYHLIDLSHISKDVTASIDVAQWFLREGELVINIFKQDLRVASIAFSISIYNGEKVAYLGAVQGIHSGIATEESLEIYRVLTKDFEGLRPRSLLVEVLKVVLGQLQIQKIYAISEQHRHHRHPYFGNTQETVFKSDYNTFWEEHGGTLDAENGFYELPTKLAIKDLSEIASKKRSLYKRRYEIIYFIQDKVQLNLISNIAHAS